MSRFNMFIVEYEDVNCDEMNPELFRKAAEAVKSLVRVSNDLHPEGPWLDCEIDGRRIFFFPIHDHYEDGDRFDLRRINNEQIDTHGTVMAVRTRTDRYERLVSNALRLICNITNEIEFYSEVETESDPVGV